MLKVTKCHRAFLQRGLVAIVTTLLSLCVGQNELPALEAELYLGWDAASTEQSRYPWQDVVPVGVRLNRDSYVYLWVIRPDGRVSLNYPSPYVEANPDNVIWGGQGQDFLRFVPTGTQNGILGFFFLASLEPLTQVDMSQFGSVEAIRNARLSTSWFVVQEGRVQVDLGATVGDTEKQLSPLWEHYQYILANERP